MDLVVLLDGTWNDLNENTNVSQIYERLVAAPGNGHDYRCHYVPGVGTGRFDRLRGGIFGFGLDDNIREGYRFLAANWRSEQDRIFLIGYSRGAFTARSLAGMIAKCGLADLSAIGDEELFARYRDTDAPGLRELREDHGLAATPADHALLDGSRLVRIRFVGVFDTVGALGIPGTLGRWLSRRRYQFHDTQLSGLVDQACHLMAVDERRRQFAPTLWTGVPRPTPGHPTVVEQRWFVGAHGDVGGGGSEQPPLAALTREWLVERAAAAGLAISAEPVPDAAWQGVCHDPSSSGIWRILRLLPGNGPYLRPMHTGADEVLDGSVVRRWGWGAPPYRPANPSLRDWVRQLSGTG
ncbi:hypothetical protein BLA60_17185 [Actinophytocola xinjiangensis]|uniref:T6SS Phospholipase effector Tle1-like catalytic domain-containing protein n=2 Tax=Actinophytocola xinjiangensis TaxID=485602 RepID=A0A7Z1AYS3_9PSEU|nr:hypothetical protein BLA60_17185 [Actinophytocola xinjiangensis]